MDQFPVPYTRGYYLLIHPHAAANGLLLTAAANLAQRGPLRVLDCGNRFNAYQVSQALQRLGLEVAPLLERIQVARAFTCHQVPALLESASRLSAAAAGTGAEAPAGAASWQGAVLALDFLSTFCDENVPLAERQRLLRGCLPALRRLGQAATVLVCARPNPLPLAELLASAADETWQVSLPEPPSVLRLFLE